PAPLGVALPLAALSNPWVALVVPSAGSHDRFGCLFFRWQMACDKRWTEGFGHTLESAEKTRSRAVRRPILPPSHRVRPKYWNVDQWRARHQWSAGRICARRGEQNGSG